MGNSLQANAQKRRIQRNSQLKQRKMQVQNQINKRQKQLSLSQKRKILTSTVFQLGQLLNQGEVNSLQLVLIFAEQAIKANQELNFITDQNFQEAITLAIQCDQQRKVFKKQNWTFGRQWDMDTYFSPIYGIPISVKDYIKMKGFVSYFGLKSRFNKIQPQDGSIIQCFRNAGAIPLFRSNMPQLAMSFETNNNLWGLTLNPWNKDKTPGGSSGGESAAVSSCSSVIGIGTDTAGSLRIPAEFCGVFALKCSRFRIPNDAIIHPVLSLYASNNINSSVGPIAKSVDDIAIWMKTATHQEFYRGKYDLYTNLFPFDQKLYQKLTKQKMRVGFINQLTLCQPTVASRRALQQVKAILQKLGFQLVEIDVPGQWQIFGSFIQEIAAQGNLQSLKHALNGQQFIKEYKKVAQITSPLFKTISWMILNTPLGKIVQSRKKFLIQNLQPKKQIHDYLQHGGKIQKFKQQWIKYLRNKKIDVLIMPGFGCQACSHGTSGQFSTIVACYSYIWNILDMTVGQQPITLVRNEQKQIVYQSKFDDSFARHLNQVAKISVGLPVGLQVVGMPFEEQKVLALMKIIQRQVNFYAKHPLPVI